MPRYYVLDTLDRGTNDIRDKDAGGGWKDSICTCTHAVLRVARCLCLGLARRAIRGPCGAAAAVEVELAGACCADVGIVGCTRVVGRSGASIGAAARIGCALGSDEARE